jgi:hypothetical protein
MKITINVSIIKGLFISCLIIFNPVISMAANSESYFEYKGFTNDLFIDNYTPFSSPTYNGSIWEQTFTPFGNFYGTDNRYNPFDPILYGPGGDPIGGLPLTDAIPFLLGLGALYAISILIRNLSQERGRFLRNKKNAFPN